MVLRVEFPCIRLLTVVYQVAHHCVSGCSQPDIFTNLFHSRFYPPKQKKTVTKISRLTLVTAINKVIEC